MHLQYWLWIQVNSNIRIAVLWEFFNNKSLLKPGKGCFSLLSSSNLFVFRIQPGPKVVGHKGFICIIIHIWAQSVRAKYTSQLSWQICPPFLYPHLVHFLWMAFFLNRQTVPVFLHFFLWSTFKSKTLCLRVTQSVMPIWVIPANYKCILFAFDYIALGRYYINFCNLSDNHSLWLVLKQLHYLIVK